MEELVYEIFKSLNFDGYIAQIYDFELSDYKRLYFAEKKLIEDGYIITKVDAPYIHCLKIDMLENK